MFDKKGVDAVVATVLIIMITVSAVAVIWAFVVPMIKNSAVSSTAETAKLSIETSGGYTTWDEVQKIARVQIKRGNDNVNLTGLDFNFVKQGNSKKNQTNEVPQPNQIKVYEFNLSDFGKPEKVTVAPITASGVGNVVSQSDVIQNYTHGHPPCESFTYNDWTSCVNGKQNRTVNTSIPSVCVGGVTPVLENNSCTLTCSSFTYHYSVCDYYNSEITVSLDKSFPLGCIGGNPQIGTIACGTYPLWDYCYGNDYCQSGLCHNVGAWSQCIPQPECSLNIHCADKGGYCGHGQHDERICTSGANGLYCLDKDECSSNYCDLDENSCAPQP